MPDLSVQIQNELLHHPRNLGIHYDPDPHIYTRYYDDGDSERYYGVTSFLKKYAPFEAKKIKYAIAKRDGITVEEVEAQWEQARQQGTDLHDDLEGWGTTGAMPDKAISRDMIRFLEREQLIPLAFEFVVYCDILKRATPIDIVLLNRYNEIVLGDYKTSKEIKYSYYEYNNKKKRMAFPLTHLPTSNFYVYSLQVALAREWLITYYNLPFRIANYGYLFHLRDGVITPHKTLSMNAEVKQIYDWEKKVA